MHIESCIAVMQYVMHARSWSCIRCMVVPYHGRPACLQFVDTPSNPLLFAMVPNRMSRGLPKVASRHKLHHFVLFIHGRWRHRCCWLKQNNVNTSLTQRAPDPHDMTQTRELPWWNGRLSSRPPRPLYPHTCSTTCRSISRLAEGEWVRWADAS